MNIALSIGTLGALVLLVAFAANELGKLEQETLAYSLLNFVGALLVLVYAIMIGSVPYIILESVWGLVALVNIGKHLAGKRKNS